MSDDSAHAHAGQEDHSHDGHDAAAGHGHDDDGPKFPFGEVIPEKNWQENFTVFCAVVCLAGLVWLFAQWMSTPVAVAEEPEHAAHPPGEAPPANPVVPVPGK
jgi:hypothetical protein